MPSSTDKGMASSSFRWRSHRPRCEDSRKASGTISSVSCASGNSTRSPEARRAATVADERESHTRMR